MEEQQRQSATTPAAALLAESQVEIRRRRVAETHRDIGGDEIRKCRPVDQIAGSGKDATDTLEL